MSHSTPGTAPAVTPDRTASERVIIAYRGPAKRKGFAQIPNVVLLDHSLSHAAKVLYGVMVGYAMQQEAFETDQAAIARDLGYSDRSVRSWMKELLDSGLLTIQRRGLNQPNVYFIEDAYALYDQKKPQPKEAASARWDRKDSSGPDRKISSTPVRKDSSGLDRKDPAGPYLMRKNSKKEEKKEQKKEAVLPTAVSEKSPEKSLEKNTAKNRETTGEKTERQSQTYRQGTAKIKAALDAARRERTE